MKGTHDRDAYLIDLTEEELERISEGSWHHGIVSELERSGEKNLVTSEQPVDAFLISYDDSDSDPKVKVEHYDSYRAFKLEIPRSSITHGTDEHENRLYNLKNKGEGYTILSVEERNIHRRGTDSWQNHPENQ